MNSGDEDNAASVFETLNDRGIGLSTPDLLRNLLLRRAPAGDREEIVECWGHVLEVEQDAKVEDFLRHYWLSREGDVKTRRLYREIKDRIENDNVSSLVFSRDLQRSASIYTDIVAASDDNEDIANVLAGVSMLGAKALLPAILSSYDIGEDDDRRMLIHSLIVFYVRHNIIGQLETSRLETVVYKLAKQLRDDGDYEAATQALREAAPRDDRFVEEFQIATVSRQKSARYLLREIEHARRATEEMQVVERPDKVHLEHIYPRRPAGERWPDHAAVVDRLGNLTLLSRRLNQAARNADFQTKKEHYAESEIRLTSELADLDVWNTNAINQRQQQLAEIALTTWSFPE